MCCDACGSFFPVMDLDAGTALLSRFICGLALLFLLCSMCVGVFFLAGLCSSMFGQFRPLLLLLLAALRFFFVWSLLPVPVLGSQGAWRIVPCTLSVRRRSMSLWVSSTPFNCLRRRPRLDSVILRLLSSFGLRWFPPVFLMLARICR